MKVGKETATFYFKKKVFVNYSLVIFIARNNVGLMVAT